MAEEQAQTKSLEKMTVKDLRQLALGMGGISGVHAMKKEEIIEAIKEIKGISDEPTDKLSADLIRSLKKKINALKEQQVKAQETGDKTQMKIVRRKISRLKKKTRRAAAA